MWSQKVSSLLPKRNPMTLMATSTVESTRYLSALITRRTTTTKPSSCLASSSFLSSSSSSLTATATSLQNHQNQHTSPYLCRSYVSRAHPRPIPEYPVPTALQMVLDGVEERKICRATKWERNKDKRQLNGKTEDLGAYRNQNETIELAINLNVDPRRPGQALRGSMVLPHGTGKTVSCLVFTSDETTIEEAKNVGHEAGGEELIDKIKRGEIAIDQYQRALATKETLPRLQKQLARLLGPRGLMPNLKTNTVFDEGTALLTSLKEQSSTVTYRTESDGILHFPIGRGSFNSQQLKDNLQTICQTIQDVKPEQYGKGKKKKAAGKSGNSKKQSKNVKYWLKAHLTATQGKGSVRLDLRTIDPTSPFFMKEPE